MVMLKHSVRRAAGYVVITDPAEPMPEEHETLMCAHCQKHWYVQPGSGIERGWCFRCQGPTCGKQTCERDCVPWELMLERLEAASRLSAAIERTRAL